METSFATSQLAAGMDTMLADDEWLRWRESHSEEPVLLAEGARAWCTSRFWQNHTPRLEHWKLTLRDLHAHALSEEDLENMAEGNASAVCFPLIPLFEYEQVSDFFPQVADVMMAAKLAEQLTRASMLSLPSSDVPRICWDLMDDSKKKGWNFTAWSWLIFPSELGDKAWPSEDGIRTLCSAGNQRAAEAVRLVERIAEERSQAGSGDSAASATLALLIKLRHPFDPVESSHTDYNTTTQPIEGETRISVEYQLLYEELFTDPPDILRWKDVEEVTRSWDATSATPLPLSAMALDLGQSDLSPKNDQIAWHNLVAIFQACPYLMKAESIRSTSPLPALELAAAVRSTIPIGRVAIDLLLLVSPSERLDSDWWRALKAGLKPLTRRSGLELANDRIRHAISSVASQARWMTMAEQQAMNKIFNPEKTHDRQ